MASKPAGPPNPAEQLLQMISGHWVAQSIRAAAILGVADTLTEGGLHYEKIAANVEAHPRALYRLLRALASIGIFRETEEPGVFELTPVAELLCTDRPDSLRYMAIYQCDPEIWKSFANIMHTLKTGEIAFDDVFGLPVFEHFAKTGGENFNKAMTAYTTTEAVGVAQTYDFSKFKTYMDVGGGLGLLITRILEANPTLKGILFDTPHVIDQAKATMAPLADRCELVAGDFFESVPTGADVISMKSIIHDWDDEKAKKILASCHTALPENGTLLLCENVVPPRNEPHPSKFLDVNLMLLVGGIERTEEEFTALLTQTGFKVNRIITMAHPMSIIEAQKV